MINRENLIKIGRAGGNTSNRETPDQIGRVGMSGSCFNQQKIKFALNKTAFKSVQSLLKVGHKD